jgi:undecaprenyl diphosphate synthase
MAMQAPVQSAVPIHVAIIMDGNRRWARKRGIPAAEGYRRGVGALRASVRAALASGVRILTVYGFSTENWARDPSEVRALMQLCAIFARTELAALRRQGVAVGVVGDVSEFPRPARAAIARLVRATAHNRRLTLNLALNYSGRAEIVRAVRKIAGDIENGSLRARDVDESALRRRFYAPHEPDPDLLIRTGGDFRVSNFLLFQLAYTELLTLPVMWPDFTEDDFARALTEYGERCRRFGS